jgi:hypothetical protein
MDLDDVSEGLSPAFSEILSRPFYGMLQVEVVSGFPSEEKKVAKSILEGMILKHEAKRWSSSSS